MSGNERDGAFGLVDSWSHAGHAQFELKKLRQATLVGLKPWGPHDVELASLYM